MLNATAPHRPTGRYHVKGDVYRPAVRASQAGFGAAVRSGDARGRAFEQGSAQRLPTLDLCRRGSVVGRVQSEIRSRRETDAGSYMRGTGRWMRRRFS